MGGIQGSWRKDMRVWIGSYFIINIHEILKNKEKYNNKKET